MNELKYLVLFVTAIVVISGNILAVSSTSPTTQSTTISVRAEVHPHTNFSAGSKQLYPSTTELTGIQGASSVTPFDAEKFFNSSDLVDHDHLNMTKVFEKLANGSSNVSPLNASSATFKLLPTEKTPKLADEEAQPSSSLNNSNKDAINSMVKQLNQMGLQNLTVTPEKPSSHNFSVGENIHLSNRVTPFVDPSKTNQTNSSETEGDLPENPNDPLQNEYGVIIHASVVS
ncbi:hypothetical protein V9T40_001209 [Parthenolecanium corni]|uniref:Uncharacterized protein n=1 Tax=Parthenolecanium corni TaxID=536013 RepID=A0AAN9TD44_9HEMI